MKNTRNLIKMYQVNKQRLRKELLEHLLDRNPSLTSEELQSLENINLNSISTKTNNKLALLLIFKYLIPKKFEGIKREKMKLIKNFFLIEYQRKKFLVFCPEQFKQRFEFNRKMYSYLLNEMTQTPENEEINASKSPCGKCQGKFFMYPTDLKFGEKKNLKKLDLSKIFMNEKSKITSFARTWPDPKNFLIWVQVCGSRIKKGQIPIFQLAMKIKEKFQRCKSPINLNLNTPIKKNNRRSQSETLKKKTLERCLIMTKQKIQEREYRHNKLFRIGTPKKKKNNNNSDGSTGKSFFKTNAWRECDQLRENCLSFSCKVKRRKKQKFISGIRNNLKEFSTDNNQNQIASFGWNGQVSFVDKDKSNSLKVKNRKMSKNFKIRRKKIKVSSEKGNSEKFVQFRKIHRKVSLKGEKFILVKNGNNYC